MDLSEILRHCDHTLLRPTAVWDEIRTICDEGIFYHCASVCIPASFVFRAADYAAGKVKICTVIGFPNGYDTTASKCFMAKDAIENGADEIDMVVNLGDVKAGDLASVTREIAAVKKACGGHILKVIVETCYLSEDEKIALCRCVTEAGADYIKTSTGFGTAGATREDIALFAANIGPNVRIKAAGGIATLEDAEAFLALGADRLGTSRLVKLAQAKT